MSVNVTICNVPDDVRAELAARAAHDGKSMQEYLCSALVSLTEKPSVSNWLDRVAERKADYGTRLSTEAIIDARDSDRR